MKIVFWIIIIIFLVLFVVYPIPKIICLKFFSDSSSLYFYSALLQANAAILSIVGVFIIFRIQSYQSSIDIIKTALINNRRMVGPNDVIGFDNFNISEKEEYIKRLNNSVLKNHCSNWIEKEKKLKKVKSSIKLPTILLAIGIIINSIGLFTASYIHSNLMNYEFKILAAIILFQIITVYFVVKTIYNSILQ